MMAVKMLWHMPSSAHTTMVKARLAQLRALRAFLERFCQATGVGGDNCLRLNLVIEELFTNTVRHGYRGDCDAPVWVSLAAREKRITVDYEDTAPAFNPYPRASLDTTQQIRMVGGRGLVLLQRLALEREYAYLFGRNRIRLVLAAT